MKYMLLAVWLCLGLKITCAQEFHYICRIDTAASMARADRLGNIYVVRPNNELLKFNPTGKLLWTYSNRTLGALEQIDVSDPLRIMLYYPAYRQLIILNNTLSEISRYNFNEHPDRQISLVAVTSNGFWIYDEANRELIRLSNNFIDQLKTGNLYQRDGLNIAGTYMCADEQHVFINDTLSGIRIFDQFGNFYKTAVIPIKREFFVDGNEICFTNGGNAYRYNYFTFKLNKVPLPFKTDGHQLEWGAGRLLVFDEKGLTLWSFEKSN